jgi:glycosyltransferase involved in cell wall biosynthesis
VIAVNARYLLKTRISGVERYAREVVDRLAERIDICLYKPEYSSTAYQLFWEQVLLPAFLREKPVLFNPCNLAPVSYRRNVVVLHDVFPLMFPRFYSAGFRRYYGTLVPLLARQALHILTVSAFSKEQLVRYLNVPAERISVVYNGVSKRFSSLERSGADRLRRRYGLARPYILYTGSLEPRKDVGTLIRAFGWARRHCGLRDHCLVIAGNRHPNFAPAEGHFAADPEVHFLGYVDERDLPALYACAELFVYPSLCEGFGLPVLEAMASGTVALATDGSSLREILPVADLLFAPGDHKLLAEKMCNLIVNSRLREHYRGLCLEWAGRFTWEKTVRDTVRILEEFA